MCNTDEAKMMHEVEGRLLRMLYEETENDLSGVDAGELGEAIDMVKDLAEARYYASVVEAMNAEKYGTMPTRDSSGRHGERLYGPVWDDGAMQRTGGAFDRYRKARDDHRGHATADSRKAMEQSADEHMREMKESVSEIWGDADASYRGKMKDMLVSMVNGLS